MFKRSEQFFLKEENKQEKKSWKLDKNSTIWIKITIHLENENEIKVLELEPWLIPAINKISVGAYQNAD